MLSKSLRPTYHFYNNRFIAINRARLGKFLAKERSLRDGGEDVNLESIKKISEERNFSVVSRPAVPISSIISSPDTFEETKYVVMS